MSLPRSWQKYLRSRAADGPWHLEGDVAGPFTGAVVIPALAESDSLFTTLESLARNPSDSLSCWQVVVVVNHSPCTDAARQADNHKTLDLLRKEAGSTPLRLAWVDAASPGRELPARGAGVGLARKIGFDLALSGLDPDRGPVLAALDADTLVDETYLPALEAHFAEVSAGGAVLPFCHQRADTPKAQRAIDRYELFLRAYPLGLKLAGSPYAYPTVGSAMACSAEAYVRAGGMNRRAAGEDFYFLQQLSRTSGVAQLHGTVVCPSPRHSDRTLFGTGPSMARLCAGEADVVTFYAPECFEVLERWLELACSHPEGEGESLMREAGRIHPLLQHFLHQEGFLSAWAQLRRHGRNGAVAAAAFHGWFDALKTFRLVRHLSQGAFPSGEPQAMVAPLLSQISPAVAADICGLNRHLFEFWGGSVRKGVV